MRIRVTLLLLLATACAAVAQEEDQFLLRYHWNAGDEIIWNVVAETTGTVLTRDLTKDPVEEKQTPVWSRVMMPMTLIVEEVDEDGNATVLYDVGTMQMDVEAEGKTQYIVIDPEAGTMTVDGEEQPLPEGTAAGMMGPFRMVISPRGEMLDMELPEGFGMMMGGMPGVDMEDWMKMSQGWAASFPEQPIGIDHVWGTQMAAPLSIEVDEEAGADEAAEEADETQDAEPTDLPGSVSILYRLLGVQRDGGADVVQIEMLGAMDFETLPMPGLPAMDGDGGGMQMTIGPMHMSISGTLDFDVDAGELVASESTVLMDMKQHMHGTVETPQGEQPIDMEIIMNDLKVVSTVEAQ